MNDIDRIDSKCKSCRAPIRWGRKFGKAHPFNPDGSSHFDTCPHAQRFRGRNKYDYNNGSEMIELTKKWIEKHRRDDTSEIVWDQAFLHTFPDDHLVLLLDALEDDGSPLSEYDLERHHFAHCVVQDDKIMGVFVQHWIYQRLYNFYHAKDGELFSNRVFEPDKYVYVERYKIVEYDIIPDGKWEGYARNHDWIYMSQLPQTTLEKLGYSPEGYML